MRVFVTGGAGFIGSTYVRKLLTESDDTTEVTVLDSLTYAGNLANLEPVADDPRLRFIRGDIGDRALVDELVSGQNRVVHFAAESHVDRSIDSASPFVTTNVLGTQTLLDASLRHDVDTFLAVSTDEVYGSIDFGSWKEADPLRPHSPYAATKASADLLCMAYCHTHGMDVRITRCSNNYGPYQFPEKIIPLFVTNLLQGRRVPLYGDGSNVRDWLHVDDHCRGIQLALDRGCPGEIYNLGGGVKLSNRDLTFLILELLGGTQEMIEWVEDRKGHDRRYSVDWAKAARELGYKPQHAFAAGLAATVEWYRDNPHWWKPIHNRASRMRPSRAPDRKEG